ncbi:hypothetical protein BD779DRAFT_1403164, partial [Infundibulicybe gibba]
KLKWMRNHVGKHILLALRGIPQSPPLKPGVEVGTNPCGWCGRDLRCKVQLSKRGAKSVLISSSCQFHYENMSYKTAAKCSENSPCTNIPIHCPIC